jgi:hypothetical protein
MLTALTGANEFMIMDKDGVVINKTHEEKKKRRQERGGERERKRLDVDHRSLKKLSYAFYNYEQRLEGSEFS